MEDLNMNTNHKNRILEDLAKPFDPARVEWKPGAISSDKKKALALAYADLRAYQNRLDEVCSMEWTVTYTPWGSDRIICHLTICGVTRSSTGEADSSAERSEIAGTATEAQAFKRACAMFALGRYLYTLPSVWVEYDAQSKSFTANAQSRLTGIIVQHHQRYLATVQPPAVSEGGRARKAPALWDGNELPPVLPSANEDADPANVASEPEETTATFDALAKDATADTLDLNTLHTDINLTGKELFGSQWIVAVPWMVELWTTKHTPTHIRHIVAALNVDESDRFLSGMVQHSAAVLAEWKKHLANEALTTMPPTVARRPVSATRPAPRRRVTGPPSTRF